VKWVDFTTALTSTSSQWRSWATWAVEGAHPQINIMLQKAGQRTGRGGDAGNIPHRTVRALSGNPLMDGILDAVCHVTNVGIPINGDQVRSGLVEVNQGGGLLAVDLEAIANNLL